MRTLTLGLISGLFAVTLSGYSVTVAAEEESNRFSDLCESEECERMIRNFEEYGQNGHAGSMVFMALAYAHGDGVEMDHDKASMWLREAIRMRSQVAPYVAAQWYREGIVWEQDLEEAEDYIDRAISYGYPLAMFDRSVKLLQAGEDIEEGLDLLERAAEEKLPNAQYLLARLIEEGQYYQQDVVAAGLMYRGLAVKGYRDSRARLDNIVDAVRQVEEAPTVVAAEESREDILNDLTAYDDMEVITVTGRYESFEAQIADIQAGLESDYANGQRTGTRLRRSRQCGVEGGIGCSVIFDRDSNHVTGYSTLAGMLRMPGGY
ncbi:MULTISPECIES: tetratricopeptide repeat protein [Gammaproteobacteria]|uniref:tetratricopeptide repeat protein n=1 Tax=Gammaproteobacteria TaxID=1236 RepID=UPI000DCFA7B7|nr:MULTISPECIES: tetratricopeptide repeat protein [Gammaproteobacteria]RTE85924.1 sel1 repeat family protein [Aliidiomarina sp. B3213]TCZ90077.1 sel1 repeat family protein [Lysobacter sp. N42]